MQEFIKVTFTHIKIDDDGKETRTELHEYGTAHPKTFASGGEGFWCQVKNVFVGGAFHTAQVTVSRDGSKNETGASERAERVLTARDAKASLALAKESARLAKLEEQKRKTAQALQALRDGKLELAK